MSAVGYTIAGVLIGLGAILAGGILGGLWFAVNSMRPELLQKPPREGD
jgi:uncharacterized protein YneF (UPF0154 family)